MKISTRDVGAMLTTLAMAATNSAVGTGATCCTSACFIQIRASAGIASRILKELAVHANGTFHACILVMLMLAMAGPAVAQDNGVQQPSARQQLQHIHTPRSIDQELAHLVKDLELTPEQQQQVRPLLEEHQNRIQTLLDKNPAASRQDLASQIHAISDETHRKIHTLLTDHQKVLEKAMQQRERNGGENRRSAPSAEGSPEVSSLASARQSSWGSRKRLTRQIQSRIVATDRNRSENS
jgi:hypothetical protein